MKPEKRKQLEAAGWRVGTAREFLGLTDEEAALIELKLDLARAVKTERTRRKMTQEELGERLGSSQRTPREAGGLLGWAVSKTASCA
jgi:hypothetical protein